MPDRFLIDARFIIKRVADTFLGANLLTANGVDTTFTFGFVRDLLRMRQRLGIHAGAVVLGNALNETPDCDRQALLGLLGQLGVPRVDDPRKSAAQIINSLHGRFTPIVTAAKALLQLSRDGLTIVLGDARHPSEYEWYSMEIVRAKIGVEPIKIPTYLALTTFAKTALSHKQAVRLIELYGDLDAIYTHLGQITAVARKQLQVNEEPLRRRFAQLQMDRRVTVAGYNLRSLSLGFDAKRHRQVLEKNGFYSLLPLLARPTPVELLVKERDRQKFAHKAVVDKESMIALESDIGATRHCAIDTESDGKDPREATLLGVAFCCRTGVAYFVPLIERDLQSVTRGDVLDWLKRILQRDVGWVGHNIKYDDVLLRMHGLEMKTVCFDTMLAAKECHGDLESYSLQELSEHLLGKKIAAYRDLVDEGSTFLDLPFKDMVCHGCEDAEVTFRLHEALGRRLKERRLEDQFLGDSMGRLRRVCDWEFSGIRVNEGKANRVRDMMVAEATRKKDAIAREMGNGGDIDSPKDLAAMLNAFLGMRTCGEKGKVTLATLERIAIVKPVVRAIVEYKRLRSRIRAVEAILSAMTGGKIYPSFNVVGSQAGIVSTSRPSLEEIGRSRRLRACFPRDIHGYFRDAHEKLDRLSSVVDDRNLKGDRMNGSNENRFMANHALMEGLAHDELLLSLVVGEEDASVSREFLVDRLTVSTIRHDVEKRYARTFEWLRRFRNKAAESGCATVEGKRKYLDGLKSVNIATRRESLRHVVRWLLTN